MREMDLSGGSLNVVIASAAKQSRVSPRKDTGLLRCARSDGVKAHTEFSNARFKLQAQFLVLAAHCARAMLVVSPSSQEEGAGRPGARCTHGPLCARTAHECTAGKTTGSAATSRPSLRSGLTAYALLSPAANSFSSPSPRELTMPLIPVGPDPPPQSLTAATAARTTRFCRTRQHRSSCAMQSLTV